MAFNKVGIRAAFVLVIYYNICALNRFHFVSNFTCIMLFRQNKRINKRKKQKHKYLIFLKSDLHH